MSGMPDKVDLVELMFVGGRLRNERSHALPSSPGNNYYGNPADNVRFESEKMQTGATMEMQKIRTKDAETVLAHEIENWMRWGRKKDWRPASYRCPMGFMYRSSSPVLRCDDLAALKLERIIVALPERHRQAFVMHHLDRAASNGVVYIKIGRNEGARLLGVQVRQYHYLVNQAHAMVLREYSRLDGDMGEID